MLEREGQRPILPEESNGATLTPANGSGEHAGNELVLWSLLVALLVALQQLGIIWLFQPESLAAGQHPP
jgi:hypothetical protein